VIVKPEALRSAISIYLGQATAAGIIGWITFDPFFLKLAAFSVGAVVVNAVFILIQWMIWRAE
jgi:hypothetical protein